MLFAFSSCTSYFEPLKTNPATLGTVTEINKELQKLPKPKEKVVAAVYKFRDQTGQYKQTVSGGTSWSTAVTQGATSILLRALDDSGWFISIEREGLSNLLNERKIIRSSRANFNAESEEDASLLPPLLYAGIILEGGIISYDTNILTGGIGAKYFGAGGSAQYRQDRVTIYLRAVSTQSGRILKTVYTTKTVLSQMVDVGLFRFVEFKRLLEVEAGYSYNEPPEICVTEAIEKAVQSLIIEGILDGLWELENPADKESETIKDYLEEKQENLKTDYFDQVLLSPKTIGFGFNAGVNSYSGDYANTLDKLTGDITLQLMIDPQFSTSLSFGIGELAVEKYFTTTLNFAELRLNYDLFPLNQFSPVFSFGFSGNHLIVKDRYNQEMNLDNEWIFVVSTGAGIKYLFSENWGINLLIDYNYSLRDELDGLKNGSVNDSFWRGRAGIMFFPGF